MAVPTRDLFPLRLALAAAALLAAAPLAALPVEVEARLTLPAGAETQIDSPASLPVLAIAEPNLPVRKTAVLAQLDKEKLEKELDGARKNLASAQAEKRRLATERKATSSNPASTSRADMQSAQQVNMAETQEQQALGDITSITTQIQQALVRAPEDGFLAKSLYAVGGKTKKRKPFLVFAEASKTVINASVPASEAAPFAVGAKVRLSATTGEVKSFAGKVVTATPAGGAVDLRIQPLELPFFPLNTTQHLAISPSS